MSVTLEPSNPDLSESYSSWSRDCYERRVQPLLRQEDRSILDGVRSASWLSTCDSGNDVAVRNRLFPGSLLILWVEALGGPNASQGIEPVAAALECLHNASLVHDDILDAHDVRRRQPTLYAAHGMPFALLGGDGLFAAALVLLGKLDDRRLAGCVTRLGLATEEMVAGQWLDEPASWECVEMADWEAHWLRVCRGKLALGNVWGSLGAFWTGREEIEGEVATLLREFSVISQILNDFGDSFGWTGYHELAPDLREPGHEAKQKPTLPSIWSAASASGVPAATLLARARDEIERRRAAAVEGLSRIDLDPLRAPLLTDFLLKPRIPQSVELKR
jgi:geranylgeranyl pyrophosphate synthase